MSDCRIEASKILNPLDIAAYTGIPYGMYQEELQREIEGIYGDRLLKELGEVIRYYQIYDDGMEFLTEGSNGDYSPADLRYRSAANLVDKQARFMFGKPVEFTFSKTDKATQQNTVNESDNRISELQDFFDNVLEKNKFADKCLKAFKDACIGKRVAYTVDFNEKGIFITFLPSYSFLFQTNTYGELTKLITFHTEIDAALKQDQRIYRKKWWMEETGICWVVEEIYDGTGAVVETLLSEQATKFDRIPGGVIINDGLTGDELGLSDIRQLAMYEGWYSMLANADIDAERQNMNPIRYAIDIDPSSMENLSIAAGALWDLKRNNDLDENARPSVGVLETGMNYSNSLSKTLDRLATQMHDTVDVPNINADSMTGTITSGKTLKAIYWPLVVRCDEKMIAWGPALRDISQLIILGANLYPQSASAFGKVPNVEYTLKVDNPYPLPEDEIEEKQMDLQEVNAQAMSRKAYMIKWRNLTSNEADEELDQILKEQNMFDTSYSRSMFGGSLLAGEEGDSNAALEE